MKMTFFTSLVLFLTLQAQAQDRVARTNALTVSDARIFAPIKGTNATAGYGTLTNSSDKSVKVTLADVSPFKAVELHETSEVDGRMAMKKVNEFVIPAKGSFELKPGGNHIMLFDASRAVKENETLKVVFKVDGKAQELDFKVVPRVKEEKPHHH